MAAPSGRLKGPDLEGAGAGRQQGWGAGRAGQRPLRCMLGLEGAGTWAPPSREEAEQAAREPGAGRSPPTGPVPAGQLCSVGGPAFWARAQNWTGWLDSGDPRRGGAGLGRGARSQCPLPSPPAVSCPSLASHRRRERPGVLSHWLQSTFRRPLGSLWVALGLRVPAWGESQPGAFLNVPLLTQPLGAVPQPGRSLGPVPSL